MECNSPAQRFVKKMLSARRPKNVKQAKQCNLVGKAVQLIPNEEVNTLLSHTLGDEIWQHTWQKVFRVMVNGKVYYSEEYKRMRKRICYAVMFFNSAELEFGLIQYFAHNKDTKETYAVVAVPEVSESPPELRTYSIHHIWLSRERKTLMVVNVAAIEEKVFYLSGNKQDLCFARAPNFVERE